MKVDYAACVQKIRAMPLFKKVVILLGKWLPLVVILVYIITALFLLITENRKIWMFLAIPALCLVSVTILHNTINHTHPYDAMGYLPLLSKKSGAGKSFPSRHTASAWVIASACCFLSPLYGGIMFVVALLVGTSRVLAGVHYLSDVLVGAGFALLCSLLFFLPV